eukprot:jgi/Bigna1/61082/fgenesh1_kg.18_\
MVLGGGSNWGRILSPSFPFLLLSMITPTSANIELVLKDSLNENSTTSVSGKDEITFKQAQHAH